MRGKCGQGAGGVKGGDEADVATGKDRGMAAANLASPAPKRPARCDEARKQHDAHERKPQSHVSKGTASQPAMGQTAAMARTALFGIFMRARSDQATHRAIGIENGKSTRAWRRVGRSKSMGGARSVHDLPIQRGKAAGRGLEVLGMGVDWLHRRPIADRDIALLDGRKGHRLQQFGPLGLGHVHHGGHTCAGRRAP